MDNSDSHLYFPGKYGVPARTSRGLNHVNHLHLRCMLSLMHTSGQHELARRHTHAATSSAANWSEPVLKVNASGATNRGDPVSNLMNMVYHSRTTPSCRSITGCHGCIVEASLALQWNITSAAMEPRRKVQVSPGL